MVLTLESQALIKNFNICIINFHKSVKTRKDLLYDDESKYYDILNSIEEKLYSEEYNIKILKYVIKKLSLFSEEYSVNISKFDDLKVNYYIALYFLEEDEEYSKLCENKIILVILHKIMCSSLIAYEPKIILDKLKIFIHKNSYQTFKNEYGSIGYYHMIKSIYLMQKISATEVVKKNQNHTDLKNHTWILDYLEGRN